MPHFNGKAQGSNLSEVDDLLQESDVEQIDPQDIKKAQAINTKSDLLFFSSETNQENIFKGYKNFFSSAASFLGKFDQNNFVEDDSGEPVFPKLDIEPSMPDLSVLRPTILGTFEFNNYLSDYEQSDEGQQQGVDFIEKCWEKQNENQKFITDIVNDHFDDIVIRKSESSRAKTLRSCVGDIIEFLNDVKDLIQRGDYLEDAWQVWKDILDKETIISKKNQFLDKFAINESANEQWQANSFLEEFFVRSELLPYDNIPFDEQKDGKSKVSWDSESGLTRFVGLKLWYLLSCSIKTMCQIPLVGVFSQDVKDIGKSINIAFDLFRFSDHSSKDKKTEMDKQIASFLLTLYDSIADFEDSFLFENSNDVRVVDLFNVLIRSQVIFYFMTNNTLFLDNIVKNSFSEMDERYNGLFTELEKFEDFIYSLSNDSVPKFDENIGFIEQAISGDLSFKDLFSEKISSIKNGIEIAKNDLNTILDFINSDANGIIDIFKYFEFDVSSNNLTSYVFEYDSSDDEELGLKNDNDMQNFYNRLSQEQIGILSESMFALYPRTNKLVRDILMSFVNSSDGSGNDIDGFSSVFEDSLSAFSARKLFDDIYSGEEMKLEDYEDNDNRKSFNVSFNPSIENLSSDNFDITDFETIFTILSGEDYQEIDGKFHDIIGKLVVDAMFKNFETGIVTVESENWPSLVQCVLRFYMSCVLWTMFNPFYVNRVEQIDQRVLDTDHYHTKYINIGPKPRKNSSLGFIANVDSYDNDFYLDSLFAYIELFDIFLNYTNSLNNVQSVLSVGPYDLIMQEIPDDFYVAVSLDTSYVLNEIFNTTDESIDGLGNFFDIKMKELPNRKMLPEYVLDRTLRDYSIMSEDNPKYKLFAKILLSTVTSNFVGFGGKSDIFRKELVDAGIDAGNLSIFDAIDNPLSFFVALYALPTHMLYKRMRTFLKNFSLDKGKVVVVGIPYSITGDLSKLTNIDISNRESIDVKLYKNSALDGTKDYSEINGSVVGLGETFLKTKPLLYKTYKQQNLSNQDIYNHGDLMFFDNGEIFEDGSSIESKIELTSFYFKQYAKLVYGISFDEIDYISTKQELAYASKEDYSRWFMENDDITNGLFSEMSSTASGKKMLRAWFEIMTRAAKFRDVMSMDKEYLKIYLIPISSNEDVYKLSVQFGINIEDVGMFSGGKPNIVDDKLSDGDILKSGDNFVDFKNFGKFF